MGARPRPRPLPPAPPRAPRAAPRAPDPAPLEARLGHRFAQPALLALALTHASASNDGAGAAASYQRLEFLGDRVLGLAAAAMLVEAYPEEAEGRLARRLAALVRAETCAHVAREWDLGALIRLGGEAAQWEGRAGEGALADACEAVIGALFLDGGYAAAEAAVRAAWGPLMRGAGAPPRDAKTALQEWAQGRGLPPPTYEDAARTGPDHAPAFVVVARVEGLAPQPGEGASKREAQKAAAAALLAREGGGEVAP